MRKQIALTDPAFTVVANLVKAIQRRKFCGWINISKRFQFSSGKSIKAIKKNIVLDIFVERYIEIKALENKSQ